MVTTASGRQGGTCGFADSSLVKQSERSLTMRSLFVVVPLKVHYRHVCTSVGVCAPIPSKGRASGPSHRPKQNRNINFGFVREDVGGTGDIAMRYDTAIRARQLVTVTRYVP